ncbi:Gfo/Idh/MocA family protein [Paenibacillus sacheonensis]|uniref:Gfo/Idh/MocA family oxidoreductase n=1 Tax=Paenibacillus sacheonensis TaxID=742054 RepID=A0A7X5BXP7_9BACL|nr:Gfo/Idh/MocA family oxidoreductase [Paenibacillus sacheonensis]MBM7565844.1 putative dehydrogenase [Paenibacillus sacheonensis]NBC68837.1 Gfo/Idh/MocA family oxidoreductase [Paenibacillus sacheonensis]
MLKIGIIGAGMMGGTHASTYANIYGVELVGVADERVEAAQRLAAEHEARSYGSIEELIQVENPDIIDICLPTDLHKAHVLYAASCGKHVFCEKPIAMSVEDALEMTEACSAAGVTFMIGHALRFSPDYQMAKEIVEEGKLGTIGTVRMIREGAPPGWSAWFKDKSRSGGVIVDLGIHELDWLRSTFGEPLRVYAKIAEEGLPGEHAFVSIRMKSGVIAHLTASWALPDGFRSFLELAGTEGLMKLDSDDHKPIAVTRRGAGAELPSSSWESPLNRSPYEIELRHFVDCVRTGTEPLVTGTDAAKSLELALAALRSAQTGEVVTFE